MLRKRTSKGRLTTERRILQEYIEEEKNLMTHIPLIQGGEQYDNNAPKEEIGLFTPLSARRAVISDMELHKAFKEKGLDVPYFYKAGPRENLLFDPHNVRAAIVTTGGLAPGLHCVIHSIVKRHCNTYGPNDRIFGVYNSFKGLCNLADNLVKLTPEDTRNWLDQGGSQLGIIRYHHKSESSQDRTEDMIGRITSNLEYNNIDILYVIGGDGSLRIAHKISEKNPNRSIVGIPKTMDNDILWVWNSFGFDTAVEFSKRTINTLHGEAVSTRRICLIELFGAESGFIAANAALASGHVDVVLIPEVFHALSNNEAIDYLTAIVGHIGNALRERPHDPHAVVVVAEGVGTFLEKKNAMINGALIKKDTFVNQLSKLISEKVRDAHGETVPVFINQPRHYVRAVPANAHDHIYCERLGALAVDNALAGFTSFMISQWLTEYVLVPTILVTKGQKSIPLDGMSWRQVVSSTRQPLSSAETR